MPARYPLQACLAAVEGEVYRQDQKWGEQNHADGTGPTALPLVAAKVRGGFSTALQLANAQRDYNDTLASTGVEPGVTWTDILLEEVFEALAEDDEGRLADELVQVAAVAVQWVLSIHRRQARRAAAEA